MNHWLSSLLGLLTLAMGLSTHPTPSHSSKATVAEVATVLHTKVHQLLSLYVKDLLQGAILKGDHRLPSLPLLSGSATDLDSVQADVSLPAIQSSLRTYEAHLVWLRDNKLIQRTNLTHKITEVLRLLQSLAFRVEDEMQKLNLPRQPTTSFALTVTKNWPTLRAGYIILRDLRIFLNKSAHELLELYPEW
ncbi:interleukin-11-like [Mobula hypostoma]|uniref:interleukin-11-like n=1 Tax=Mobula hypostoma TaxID=723540 RepID=UPI002FC38382